MLSSLLALIERLSLFTTAATATAGLSLSLLGESKPHDGGSDHQLVVHNVAALQFNVYFGH